MGCGQKVGVHFPVDGMIGKEVGICGGIIIKIGTNVVLDMLNLDVAGNKAADSSHIMAASGIEESAEGSYKTKQERSIRPFGFSLPGPMTPF